MGSPAEREAGRAVERRGRWPWPAVVIVAGLAVVGAVTMAQRILAIFSWLITLLMIIVVMVALAAWLVSERRRR